MPCGWKWGPSLTVVSDASKAIFMKLQMTWLAVGPFKSNVLRGSPVLTTHVQTIVLSQKWFVSRCHKVVVEEISNADHWWSLETDMFQLTQLIIEVLAVAGAMSSSLSIQGYIREYQLDTRMLRALVRHGHLSSSFGTALDEALGSRASSSRDVEPPQQGQPSADEAIGEGDDAVSVNSSLRLSQVIGHSPTPSPSASLEEVKPGMPEISTYKMCAIYGKTRYHSRHCRHTSRPEVRKAPNIISQVTKLYLGVWKMRKNNWISDEKKGQERNIWSSICPWKSNSGKQHPASIVRYGDLQTGEEVGK